MKAKFGGSCDKNSEHKWNEGDEVFMYPKSGSWDDKSKGWIVCNNKDCFIAQGGKIEERKQFQSTKFKLDQVNAIKDITFGLMDKFEKKYQTSTTPQHLSLENRAIMFESLFRTLSQNYKS